MCRHDKFSRRKFRPFQNMGLNASTNTRSKVRKLAYKTCHNWSKCFGKPHAGYHGTLLTFFKGCLDLVSRGNAVLGICQTRNHPVFLIPHLPRQHSCSHSPYHCRWRFPCNFRDSCHFDRTASSSLLRHRSSQSTGKTSTMSTIRRLCSSHTPARYSTVAPFQHQNSQNRRHNS